MHYYPFNIGDYRKDTSRLNFLEHGIYRLLIDEYYLNESPLNPDLNFLYREFGIRTQEEKDCINYILGKFFVLDKNGYSHYGCEKVLKKIYDKSDKARKSVEARWSRKNTDVPKNDTDVQQSNTDVPKNDTTDILPITHNPLPITHINTQADKQLSLSTKKEKIEYTKADLISIGIDESIARDFLITRKAKKAKLTETAFAGIVREAEKANLTIQQALQICVERNWQSFKAEWVQDKQSGDYITFYELATGQKPEF